MKDIGNAQGEDVSGQGINCHEGIDWNEDTVNTIFVPSDHNYTFYAVFGHKVTFDTRSGSEIAPQYVIPGEKAARPDDPIKGGGAWQGGGDFVDWYADKALTQRFNFNTPITEDTTVYAKWAYGFSISSYDKTNSADYAGGQYMVLQHGVTEDDMYYGGSNYTLCEGDAITLKVYPDKGYKFAGWYKGEYIGMVDDEHTQVSRPLDMSNPDNLLSVDLEYSFTVDQSTVICPVFEACTEHQWEQKIQKAMRELMKDKTCFVIAHRLSTIQNADKILVVDHGDVVEQGTHESLMEKKGFYYKLYAAQFE